MTLKAQESCLIYIVSDSLSSSTDLVFLFVSAHHNLSFAQNFSFSLFLSLMYLMYLIEAFTVTGSLLHGSVPTEICTLTPRLDVQTDCSGGPHSATIQVPCSCCSNCPSYNNMSSSLSSSSTTSIPNNTNNGTNNRKFF